MNKLLWLAAVKGGSSPSKNLLNVLEHDTPHGIPAESFSNGVIDDPSIGGGNADYVWFTQTFPSGQYVFSVKTEGTGTNGVRLILSQQVSGSNFVSYYNGYVLTLTDGHVAFQTNEDDCLIGMILMTNPGHAKEPGKVYDIQLEVGTEPTPYVPYKA